MKLLIMGGYFVTMILCEYKDYLMTRNTTHPTSGRGVEWVAPREMKFKRAWVVLLVVKEGKLQWWNYRVFL